MKRLLIAFLTLCMVLLTACGSSTRGTTGTSGGGAKGLSGASSYIACPEHTNDQVAAPESGTVNLTVSGFTSSSAEDTLVQANLQNFQQAHPNIHIIWTPINDDYPGKMRANMASGNVPDVFYLQPDTAPQYITSGKLLNLTPYMAKDGVRADYYFSNLINTFSCKEGQVYGIPKDWNTLGVFYNKQMFQNAGIPDPSPNWTWNDFHAVAKQLTRPGDAVTSVYGVTIDNRSAQRWLAFFFADGGTVLNADGTQATFNSKAGQESLDFYTRLRKEGLAVTPASVGASWPGDAFGKQRAAMAIEGGWLIPYIQQNSPTVQYGIAPLPTAPNGKQGNLIFTNAWAASAHTKHPEAAWELIKFLTGQEVQESQLHAGFALPTMKVFSTDPYLLQNPDTKALFNAVLYGTADTYGPDTSDIYNQLDSAVEMVMLGLADSKTALNQAANQVDAHLRRT